MPSVNMCSFSFNTAEKESREEPDDRANGKLAAAACSRLAAARCNTSAVSRNRAGDGCGVPQDRRRGGLGGSGGGMGGGEAARWPPTLTAQAAARQKRRSIEKGNE